MGKQLKEDLQQEFIKQFSENKEVEYKGFRITYSEKFSKYLIMDIANVLGGFTKFDHAIKFLINEMDGRGILSDKK